MPHGEDGGAARAYGVLCRLLESLDWEPLLGLRAEVFIVSAEPEPAGSQAEEEEEEEEEEEAAAGVGFAASEAAEETAAGAAIASLLLLACGAERQDDGRMAV
eukprot:COSAG01_NODE_1835_length_9084_cov_87.179481_5_plen_103_part_00